MQWQVMRLDDLRPRGSQQVPTEFSDELSK